MIDIIRLCQKEGIDYKIEGHKHCRPGWVQLRCPFCFGNQGWHLGYCIEGKYKGNFVCWRCGSKPVFSVLKKLLGDNWKEKTQGLFSIQTSKIQQTKKQSKSSKCILPANCKNLSKRHLQYLEQRKYDGKELEKIWGLKGTMGSSYLVDREGTIHWYKFRIIAPIIVDSELVSFQGRDITNCSNLKYKACPASMEVTDHKKTLYGIDQSKGNKAVVVVEGITDVWRLGPGAVATFGVKFTQGQTLALASRYKRVFILFDSPKEDPQTEKQSDKLFDALQNLGIETEIIELGSGDPGSMLQKDADYLMKKLNIRRF